VKGGSRRFQNKLNIFDSGAHPFSRIIWGNCSLFFGRSDCQMDGTHRLLALTRILPGSLRDLSENREKLIGFLGVARTQIPEN
jgi:hypothetical protein